MLVAMRRAISPARPYLPLPEDGCDATVKTFELIVHPFLMLGESAE
jgi:hypothetical protein